MVRPSARYDRSLRGAAAREGRAAPASRPRAASCSAWARRDDEVMQHARGPARARLRPAHDRPVPAAVARTTCRWSSTCTPTSSPSRRDVARGAGLRERRERPARALELPRRPARRHGAAGRGQPGGLRPCREARVVAWRPLGARGHPVTGHEIAINTKASAGASRPGRRASWRSGSRAVRRHARPRDERQSLFRVDTRHVRGRGRCTHSHLVCRRKGCGIAFVHLCRRGGLHRGTRWAASSRGCWSRADKRSGIHRRRLSSPGHGGIDDRTSRRRYALGDIAAAEAAVPKPGAIDGRSERAEFPHWPTWSPDGRYIGYGIISTAERSPGQQLGAATLIDTA